MAALELTIPHLDKSNDMKLYDIQTFLFYMNGKYLISYFVNSRSDLHFHLFEETLA